jgi:xylan 1,4-beta-xylosidase
LIYILDGELHISDKTLKAKDTVIIGECDPEGCAACSMKNHPQNAYRNGTMYSSYTAASYARIYDLMEKHHINLIGAVTWAFEFENQRWFDGFRDLATNGVDKPVLNVFRMFGMMQGDRVPIKSNAFSVENIIENSITDKSDVSALASLKDNVLTLMLWNYHDDDLEGPAANVNIEIKNPKGNRALVHHYRIDATHSNSYTVWKNMGSPQEVSTEQFKQLEAAGQLQLLASPEWIETENNSIIKIVLPRQAVSLLSVEWK